MRVVLPVSILLGFYVSIFTWMIYQTSPNNDEAANLVGGLAIWKYGRFDLYGVNPPLPKMVASLPVVLFCEPNIDWKIYQEYIKRKTVGARPEFAMGLTFVQQNTNNIRGYFALARLACLPFCLLGAYFVWRWARELYGNWAALCALTLWCFSPCINTWGSMLMPDLPAASCGVMAGYFFWKWLQNPDKGNAFIAGITLGIALLTKLTWVILLPLFPMLWLLWCCQKFKYRSLRLFGSMLGHIALLLAVGIFILNLGYGFEGTGTRLDDFQFASRTLAGKDSIVDEHQGGNRFQGTIFAPIPIPLPINYVLGADLQKVDFERGMPSYLFGKWREHGWWYYYLVCAALKIPLGTWGLGILSLILSLLALLYPKTKFEQPVLTNKCGAPQNDRKQSCWIDEFLLIIPAIILFVFVSSQTGFSRHFRYVLPALPFFLIWASKAAQISAKRGLLLKMTVIALLGWSVGSSFLAFPHYMSYFNVLAGGPKNGHHFLLDSNIDWGQDLYYLKSWMKNHPEAKGIHLLLRDDISEALFFSENFPKVPPTPGISFANEIHKGKEDNDKRLLGPRPGWFAASIHRIHDEHGRYNYLLNFKPVTRIGYSIYIFHITIKEANAARQKYNLPPIPSQIENLDVFAKNFFTKSNKKRLIQIAVFYSKGHDQGATKNIEETLNRVPYFMWQPISASEIRSEGLDNFDVIICPGGSGREQGDDLGTKGKIAIRNYVARGGGYLGICAGAFLATTNDNYGLALVNLKSNIGYRYLSNEGFISQSIHGSGFVTLELSSIGKQLTEKTSLSDVRYSSGPILSHSYRLDLPGYISLASYADEITAYDYQVGTMKDTPAIILGPYGKGVVFLSGVHIEMMPEFDSIFNKILWGIAKPVAMDAK